MQNDTQTAAEQVVALGGINQRASPSRLGANDFELAIGVTPLQLGVLERVTGKQLIRQFGSAILQIHQTFDGQNHIIIQTYADGVQFYTLDELLDRASTTNLTPVTILEEDTMPRALIVDKKAAGAAASALTTSYAARDLTDIDYQLNADGTAASFITGFNGTGGTAAKQFALAAGTYRFDIRASAGVTTALAKNYQAVLFNVTTGLPAFNGLPLQAAASQRGLALANSVVWMQMKGQLTIAAPNTFEVRQKVSDATNVFQGLSVNQGENEVYAFVEITKTA